MKQTKWLLCTVSTDPSCWQRLANFEVALSPEDKEKLAGLIAPTYRAVL